MCSRSSNNSLKSRCFFCASSSVMSLNLTNRQNFMSTKISHQSNFITSASLSLCSLLKLSPVSLKYFKNAAYCSVCLELFFDLHYIHTTILNLEKQLGNKKEKVKSLLLKNLYTEISKNLEISDNEEDESYIGALKAVGVQLQEAKQEETGPEMIESDFDEFNELSLSPQELDVHELENFELLDTKSDTNEIILSRANEYGRESVSYINDAGSMNTSRTKRVKNVSKDKFSSQVNCSNNLNPDQLIDSDLDFSRSFLSSKEVNKNISTLSPFKGKKARRRAIKKCISAPRSNKRKPISSAHCSNSSSKAVTFNSDSASLKNRTKDKSNSKSGRKGRSFSRKNPLYCPNPDCKFHCFLDIILKAHIDQVHNGIDDPYVCPVPNCDAKFSNHKRYQLHQLKVHTEPTVKCPHCPRLFYEEKQVKTHSDWAHNEIQQKPRCKLCTKRCDNQEILVAHETLHNGLTLSMPNPNYPCVLCPPENVRSFNIVFELQKHVELEHEDLIKCPHCQLSFLTKKRLERHEKIFHSIRMLREELKCSECNYIGLSPSGLRYHQMKHSDLRKFKCEVEGCDKAFKHKNVLKKHIQAVHLKIPNPFTCDICIKGFRDKMSFTSHLQHHSTSRNFLCELCPSSFKSAENLRTHLKVHVDGKKVKRNLKLQAPRRPRIVPMIQDKEQLVKSTSDCEILSGPLHEFSSNEILPH